MPEGDAIRQIQQASKQWWHDNGSHARRVWHKRQPGASPATADGRPAHDTQGGRSQVTCVTYTGDTSAQPGTGLVGVAHLEAGTVFSPTCKVHVFYDLDNLKPDEVVPEELVAAIRSLVGQFGSIASMTAYGNDNTFTSEPPIAVASRRLAKQLRHQEGAMVKAGGKGRAPPPGEEYRCSYCGRRCRSAEELAKHFDQLHGREHRKKMSHKPLAKKLRADQKYMSRFREAESAAHQRGTTQLRLGQRLQDIGVQVKRVRVAPQAADELIIRDVQQLLSSAQRGPSTASGGFRQPNIPPMAAAATAVAAAAAAPPPPPSPPADRATPGSTEPAGSTAKQPAGPPPFEHAICIVSDDRGFTEVLHNARQAGWGCLAVCSARILAAQGPGTHSAGSPASSTPAGAGDAASSGARGGSRFRGPGAHKPAKPAPKDMVAGFAQQLGAQQGLPGLRRVIQAGAEVGGGGVWDLAAVQLALSQQGQVRLPILRGYPQAHVTLDFHAACALAVQASMEALQQPQPQPQGPQGLQGGLHGSQEDNKTNQGRRKREGKTGRADEGEGGLEAWWRPPKYGWPFYDDEEHWEDPNWVWLYFLKSHDGEEEGDRDAVGVWQGRQGGKKVGAKAGGGKQKGGKGPAKTK